MVSEQSNKVTVWKIASRICIEVALQYILSFV